MVPKGVCAVTVVAVPAVAAVGAPTVEAVTVSIMRAASSSLPHSGAVPAVPEPTIGTMTRISARSAPGIGGRLS